jgi:hypothetical protein
MSESLLSTREFATSNDGIHRKGNFSEFNFIQPIKLSFDAAMDSQY